MTRDETKQAVIEAAKSPWAPIITALAALITAVPTMISQLDLSGKVEEAVARQSVGVEEAFDDVGAEIEALHARIDDLEAQLAEGGQVVQEPIEVAAEAERPPPPEPVHPRARAKFAPAAKSDPRVQQLLQEDALW